MKAFAIPTIFALILCVMICIVIPTTRTRHYMGWTEAKNVTTTDLSGEIFIIKRGRLQYIYDKKYNVCLAWYHGRVATIDCECLDVY
jgi:hypothetical protein